MKIVKVFVSVVILLSLALSSSASSLPTGVSFDTKVSSIYKLKSGTRFDIGVGQIVNADEVSYWKIRVYCDRDIDIKFVDGGESTCDKATKFDSLGDSGYSFYFNNKDDRAKKFSLKLKAYDVEGKWLHTEKESFTWR